MIGILVELALSWLLLWLIEKKNPEVLGLRPNVKRISTFLIFFLLAGLFAFFAVYLRILFFKERYETNPFLTGRLIWEGFRWNLVSVLYEEFIFRGALLYILIRRIGTIKAIWISAIAFGIYHWFSFNILGNSVSMIYVFLITGTMGWILAYAYVRTASMYLAIGFHLGWNFVYGFVFSRGSIGNGVFVLEKQQPVVNISYFTYYTITFFPLLLMFVVSYWIIRKLKPGTAS